jgi:anti-sigma28 factor (negative regulator of flagellin synthesis)
MVSIARKQFQETCMMISRTEVHSAISASRPARKRTPVAPSDNYVAGDGFSLAAFAADVAQSPFFREELVNQLGRRISQGKYFVPSEQIVDKILGRLFAEAALA